MIPELLPLQNGLFPHLPFICWKSDFAVLDVAVSHATRVDLDPPSNSEGRDHETPHSISPFQLSTLLSPCCPAQLYWQPTRQRIKYCPIASIAVELPEKICRLPSSPSYSTARYVEGWLSNVKFKWFFVASAAAFDTPKTCKHTVKLYELNKAPSIVISLQDDRIQ